MTIPSKFLYALWRGHGSRLRDPAQIAAHWTLASPVDPRLLRFEADSGLRRLLRRLDITLLVSREYEHFVLAIGASGTTFRTSWFPVPHPTGIAVDRRGRRIHLASTRNPNVLFELAPASGFLPRRDLPPPRDCDRVLLPTRSRFLPGSAYLHDLAMIGGCLYGASTGQNAVVRLHYDREMTPAWWPKSIERRGGPRLFRNHLQLNSIAAGSTLKESFFTASSEAIGSKVPGDPAYPVDGMGVLFSGASRVPVGRGLTRPHSSRNHKGQVWVDNSGYGELSRLQDGRFEPLARLPGWTRGLCLVDGVAFVGTSRVIPGYEKYAPGVDPRQSLCAIHAIDLRTGQVLGRMQWPYGYQIFAIEWIPGGWSAGFPFHPDHDDPERLKRLFYSFR